MPLSPLDYFTDEQYQDLSPGDIAHGIKQLHPEYADLDVADIERVGTEARRNSPLAGGMGTALSTGLSQTWDNVKASFNTWLGDTEGVERIREEGIKGNIPTMEQSAFRESLRINQAEGDDDLLEGIGNVASAIWDEPTGAWHELIGQLPNSGVVLAGMYAGGKTGAAAGTVVAPGPGTAIGAITGGILGMFATNSMIETGAISQEYAEEGLTEEERQKAITEGAIKSGVITGIDSLTFGVNKMLLGGPGKLVEKAVTNSLLEDGVDLASEAAVRTALKTPDIARRAMDAGAEALSAATTAGQRTGRGVTAFGLETAGEGTGEYLGTAASGREASFTEAAMESLLAAPLSVGELHVAKGLVQPGELTRALQNIQGATTVEGAVAAADAASGAVSETASQQAIESQILAEQAAFVEEQAALGEEQRIELQKKQQAAARQADIDSTLSTEEEQEQAINNVVGAALAENEDLAGMDPTARDELQSAVVDSVFENVSKIPTTQEEKNQLEIDRTDEQEGTTTKYGSLAERIDARKREKDLARGQELAEVTTPEEKVKREKAVAEWDEEMSVTEAIKEAPTNPAMAAALEKAGLVTKQQAADADIHLAAQEAATSPENELSEPTDAQKEAGNYKMGKVSVNGMDISIENPRGSERTGTDPGGQKWSQTMTQHYGYIRGTVGKDKDHVDVFMGPRSTDPEGKVYVVDQVVPGSNKFDEHKVMLGFESEQEAVDAYMSNYQDGWEGLGSITEMSQSDFKNWVKDPVKTSRKASLRKFKGAPSEAMQQMREDVSEKQEQAEKTTEGQAEEEQDEGIALSPGDVKHKREKKSGRYVGAPDWVGMSSGKLGALRRKLKKLAVEGESGRYWYEKSSKAVLDFVGGNKKDAEKFVALLAIYSQGTEVNTNMGFALEAYYQWKAKMAIKSGRFPVAQSKKAEDILRKNIGWGGVKTNNFYTDLMEEIDPSKVDEEHATMDMWMAIAFDYGFKTLDQGPKYNFSKNMISNIAKELGWKPHQVQAAIWTSIKARVEATGQKRLAAEKKQGIDPQNAKDREKGSYAHFRLAHKLGMGLEITPEEIAQGSFDFSDTLDQRAAQMSWEATPSTTAGDLPGIHNASTEQKFEYLAAIQKALTDKNGEDLIAKLLNLHTPPTQFGYSAWDGGTGAGAQSMIPVPVKGLKGERAVQEPARELLDLYSAIRGLVLHQDMVIWHHPIYSDSKIRHNGFELRIQRPGTEAETQQLYQAIYDKFGNWNLAPGYTQSGYRVLNFVEGLSNKDFQKGMNEVVESLPDEFGGGDGTHVGFRSDGETITNNWKENPYGEEYQNRIETGRPDILAGVAKLRARVETVNRRFDKKYGWGEPTGTTAKFSAKTAEGRLSDGGRADVEGRSTASTKRLDKILKLKEGTIKEIPISVASTLGKFIKSFIEPILGKKVVMVNLEGSDVGFNGAILSNHPNTIYLNQDADRPHMVILGHEMLHSMKRDMPDLYQDLKTSLMPLLKEYGPYKEFVNKPRRAHKLKERSEVGIIEELIADVMGEGFGDPKFWSQVEKSNPALYKRVLTAIKTYLDGVIDYLIGQQMTGTKYFKDYKQARDLAAKALSDYASAKQGKPLAGVTIVEEFTVEETGETVTVEENASVLLKESNTRMRTLRDFKRCIAA